MNVIDSVLSFSYLCNTNKKKWWMLLTVSDLFLIFAEVINVIDSVWSLQHKRKKWWMLLRASVLSSSYHCNTKQTTMILFLLRPSTNLKFPNQSNVSEKMLEFPLSSVQDGNYRIKAHKSAFARCRCFYSELKRKTILDFFYFIFSPVSVYQYILYTKIIKKIKYTLSSPFANLYYVHVD